MVWWAVASLTILVTACGPPPPTVALCDLSDGGFDGQIVRVEALVLSGRHGVALVDASCPSPDGQVWLALGGSPEAVAFDDALWAEQFCKMREVRADMTGRVDAGSEGRVFRVTTLHGYEFNDATAIPIEHRPHCS